MFGPKDVQTLLLPGVLDHAQRCHVHWFDNHHHNKCMFQPMVGEFGTCVILLGWLVLRITALCMQLHGTSDNAGREAELAIEL